MFFVNNVETFVWLKMLLIVWFNITTSDALAHHQQLLKYQNQHADHSQAHIKYHWKSSMVLLSYHHLIKRFNHEMVIEIF